MDDKEVEQKLKKLQQQAERENRKNDPPQDKKPKRKKNRRNAVIAVVIVVIVVAVAAAGFYASRQIRPETEAETELAVVTDTGAEPSAETEAVESETGAEPFAETGAAEAETEAAEAKTEAAEAKTDAAAEAETAPGAEEVVEAEAAAGSEASPEAELEEDAAGEAETETASAEEVEVLSDSEAEAVFEEELAAETGVEAADASETTELSGWAAAAVAAKEFREAAAADDIPFISLDDIPAYSGSPYVFINGNEPFFTDSDYTLDVFETYSDLDGLGRCGPAYANLCRELMPTSNREYIRNIYPSGYHNTKYSFIDGGYVYNRCHLIAFSLAGESANEKNLITGTQYMNIDGMYPFEYMVGDYIRRKNAHVLYRVTPVFQGDDLVASGVLIEASSVEDRGEGLNFCVYCYNVQPGVEINYATGRTQSDGTMD